MESSLQIVEIPAIRYAPEFLAWVFGIVLAAIMVRRGGGRAEKLLLAGCCIMAFNQLAGPIIREVVARLFWTEAMSNVEKAMTMSWASLPMGILSLAGLVCLVWAFWVRFWIKRGRQLNGVV